MVPELKAPEQAALSPPWPLWPDPPADFVIVALSGHH
jgi:hypothetical protein